MISPKISTTKRMKMTTAFDYSTTEKKALVSIFMDKIKRGLQNARFEDILKNFTDCFDAGELRTIRETNEAKGETAAKDEIYKFASKAHDPRVFVQLVDAIEKYDTVLADELKCATIHDSNHYKEILSAFPSLVFALGKETLIDLVMRCTLNNCLTVETRATITDLLTESTPDAGIRAVCLFMRQLPRRTQAWSWLFMDALALMKNGADLRKQINKNFEADLKRYQFEQIASPPTIWADLESKSVLDEWLAPMTRNESADSGIASMTESIESSATLKKLRNYQIDLASEAICGRNTVVCAPTGSGKTLVAAEIVRHHFANGSNTRPKKTAFLVPTTQLVDQQHAELEEHLKTSTNLRLKKMVGGSNTSSSSAIPKAEGAALNDIIVTTPQVLINIFRDTTTSTPMTLTSFSLLILDECHHTDKDHPYNEIMTQYMDMKIGDPRSAPNLPQVVSLSASLGVGKADDEKEALEHVVHKLANMDAQALSMVSEQHRDELAAFVNVPRDRVVTIKDGPHPLAVSIEQVMGKIEKLVAEDFKVLKPEIQRLFGKDVSPAVLPVTTDPPMKQKNREAYTNWLGVWLTKFPQFGSNPTKPAITSAFEHLRVYHKALDLNMHVPAAQARRYLTERFAEFERKQSSDRDRILIGFYKALTAAFQLEPKFYEAKNPLVERMTEILLNEFSTTPDSRVLIFVRTLDLTIALEEFMRNDARLASFNAARLTGAQASKEKGGLTAREQQDLLVRFRSGQHKILIATTVAEEGLDVHQCHLVIKYNHVTNEIAMVQRRGRGRAAGSESILLVREEWIEEKEATNILRELLMMKAVECIRARGDVWLKNAVADEQIRAYRKRMLERETAAKKRCELAGNAYDILCKKCDNVMTSTSSIRSATPHYVSVDPTIWKRLVAEPSNNPVSYETMITAGKISCNGCRNDCGILIRMRNTYLPALKFCELSLRNVKKPNDLRLVRKKWIQGLEFFNVEEIADSDMREMHEALAPDRRSAMDEWIQQALLRNLGCNSR